MIRLPANQLFFAGKQEGQFNVIAGIHEGKKIKRIVTVYEPDDRWEDNFKRRRKP